jgi:hypothetical protein
LGAERDASFVKAVERKKSSEIALRLKGKNGLFAAFSKAIPIEPQVRANRVLGMALRSGCFCRE